MSVLMRGVNMPKNCEECNFKGECRQYWEKIREAYTRPSWCPLVEVADHKTEPFDKDINVRSTTEPQTGVSYSDHTDYDEPKTYVTWTEPQTDCSWK